MLKNKYLSGRKRIIRGIFLWLMLFFLIFSFFPITVRAGDDEVQSQASGSSETTSQCDIYHTHRGSSTDNGDCYQTPVFHVHSGSASKGGACFTPVYHKHTSSCYTTSVCTVNPISWEVADYKTVDCSEHGTQTATTYKVYARHSSCGSDNTTLTQGGNCNVCGGNVHSYTHEYKKLTCSKSTSTVESYKLSCGKTEGVSVESYALSCLLNEQKYGSLILKNNTPEWTRDSVSLSAVLEDPEGVICADGFGAISFYDAEGNLTAEDTADITVTENGAVRARVTTDPAKFDSVETMLTVSNIDRTAPEITDLSFDDSSEWTACNTITLSGTDLQPDGSAGSGLADSAFSFDNGQTWQSSASFDARANGSYAILVRDNCGNISGTEVTIDNIDSEGPEVNVSFDTSGWYEDGVPVCVLFDAFDDKSGLDAEAYSNDGGITWSGESSIELSCSGTYTVCVRDRLGNVTETDYELCHDEAPVTPAPPVVPPSDDPPVNPPDDKPDLPPDDPGTDDDGDADDDDDDDDRKKNKNKDSDKDDNSSDGDRESDTDDSEGSDGDVSDKLTVSLLEQTGLNPDPEDSCNIGQDDFEGLLTPSGSPGRKDTSSDTVNYVPFYKTAVFKTASAVTGLIAALAFLVLLFIMLFSGVLVFSFDGFRYRFVGMRPIRHSSRGFCIDFPNELWEKRYSGKFRLHMGRFFVSRHRDSKLFIHTGSKWLPIDVDKKIYVEM